MARDPMTFQLPLPVLKRLPQTAQYIEDLRQFHLRTAPRTLRLSKYKRICWHALYMQALYNTLILQHDLRLVALAVLVCFLACYTAFSMMTRLYGAHSRYPWVIAAGVVIGCGSWATQAIALLAFQPGVAVAYNLGLTILSGFIALGGAGLGFWIARST